MGTERERETLLRAAPFLLPAHLPLPHLLLVLLLRRVSVLQWMD